MTENDLELRRRARIRKQKRLKKRRRKKRVLVGLIIGIMAIVVGGLAGLMSLSVNRKIVDLSTLKAPDWIEQDFFDKNPYSRPGTKMTIINEIVIHYVANPGTSARQNWNYFNELKKQDGANATSVSSHFIIGLDGEILQGIPLDEIAYATSKEKNMDTVSIECCHPDETGEFTEATYDSLVKLTAWLCDTLNLNEKDVIRHYDATGKDCPRYFVAHEDAWKRFRKDIKRHVR